MIASMLSLGHVAVAFAAACTGSFLLADCNPSLFWYDKYLRVTSSSNNKHDFTDKRVWIVGASSGIGREMALQLAGAGVQHLVLSSRSVDRLEEVANSCRADNPNCTVQVLPLDVTDTNALYAAVAFIKAQAAPLDMVVLNAGVGQLQPALETDPATTEHIIKATALWPMILTPLLFGTDAAGDASISVFRPRHAPHLVVTSSIAAKLAVPLSAVYAAAKFALQGYFLSLQAERPDLRIDLLCPGPIDTAFHQNSDSKDSESALKESQENKPSPLKMRVKRCVSLMLSAMQRGSSGAEVWIAQQPALAAVYIQQYLPGLQKLIMSKVGPKRMKMWRDGLDLYDPASWRKK